MTPEISSHGLKFYLQQNLSAHEMKIVNNLRMLQDLENMRSFLLGVPITALGSIPCDELLEKLQDNDYILPGAEDFYKTYPTLHDRQEHAHELLHSFLKMSADMPPFVHKYFRFSNIYRNILAWLRAKELHRTIEIDPEEIGFDINDVKNWPETFQDIAQIWATRHETPKDLEESLARWTFQSVDILCEEGNLFSLDLILAYLIKLRIVEERQTMNDPRHQLTLQEMVKAHD